MSRESVTVLGAGLAGTLMAILLARRGMSVTVLERRPDLRRENLDAGRSINLALAERGIHALRQAGLLDAVKPLLIRMPGRMVHDVTGATQLIPYGQSPGESIYSVSRPGLNRVLLDHAEVYPQIGVRFRQKIESADFGAARLNILDEARNRRYTLPLGQVIAADGAGSATRDSLVDTFGIHCVEDVLAHGYKELILPADANGRHRMEPHALHVWPRGGFMLIALPNLDGSFTVTLFLPFEGAESFASLKDAATVEDFFRRHFPDALAMMPGLAEEFFSHPTGRLATVRCERWTDGEHAVLIGDAAHAIVPFHGQGMNCAFEDCNELDRLLSMHDWPDACTEFSRRRKPDTDAIADMAIENYLEMRDTVRNPKFQLQKALSFELERRFPDRFIPRYSMVMFHPEIPYAVAYERGVAQAGVLDKLTLNAQSLQDIDFILAGRLIGEKLSPLGRTVHER